MTTDRPTDDPAFPIAFVTAHAVVRRLRRT
jgi:hypothetical protein